MKPKTTRLFFIDAMRAWAILMMLQGHFIDGLLDTVFRDPNNMIYAVWRYFRGITAPVFFTVSGFIFTYLLIKVPEVGWKNPRIKKGVRRGLQLLLIGYLLRMNVFGLLKGELYDGFFLVDVLHCIGLSILAIIGYYSLTANKHRYFFPAILLLTTLLLFLFEPLYKQWSYGVLPDLLANYFTKVNGSVFTIVPWLGYATFGAFASVLFTRFRSAKYLYPSAIIVATILGTSLIFFSSDGFLKLYELTGIRLFYLIELNNYLFIRLGDVFLVFAIFMLFKRWLENTTLLRIGQNTLSIYVIHFIILYGSFTGLGLYRFFYHELNPYVAILGALAFMFICTALALWYDTKEQDVKSGIRLGKILAIKQYRLFLPLFRENLLRIKTFVIRLFGLARG